MNKKIIRYLLWIILITALLVLMPIKQEFAITVHYSGDGGFKTSRNLFCLNKGDYFESEEEYSVENFTMEKFNKVAGITFVGSEETLKNVLTYIICEANDNNGNYSKKNSINEYIPQNAIWKIAGETINKEEVNSLYNRAYAYNEYKKISNIANPIIRDNQDNSTFSVYYTETSYEGETYTNLKEVNGTGFDKSNYTFEKLDDTEKNMKDLGYTHKRIYTKNSNSTTSVNVNITYETSRSASFKIYKAANPKYKYDIDLGSYHRIGDSYYIKSSLQDPLQRMSFEGENYINEINAYYNDMFDGNAVVEGLNNLANANEEGYKIYRDEGFAVFLGVKETSDGCTFRVWEPYLDSQDQVTMYVSIARTYFRGPNYQDKPTEVVLNNLEDYKKAYNTQNLLYGTGNISTGTDQETITFGLNLTLNKTDSLTGTGLCEAKFKVNLTNVSAIGNYQLPTQGAQQNSPRTVYVTTDNNGQIKLSGIIPTSTSNPITITITETAEPTANGWYYEKLTSPVTAILKYDSSSGTWKKDSGSGTFSGNTLTVGIQNKPYIDLSGNVWQDGQIDEKKLNNSYNGINDDGLNKLDGVLVELYNADENGNITGNRVDSATTKDGGNYGFKKIPKTKNGYIVVFKYDGINYKATAKNKGDDELLDSDVTEKNRDTVNSNIKTISKGLANGKVPLLYKQSEPILQVNMNGTNPANNNAEDFQVEAYTEVYKTSNDKITCGLVKKTFDLAIGTDVKSATLKINEKETTYTYAEIMNGKLNEEFDKISSSTKEENGEDIIYNLYLYSSDYNYRIGDYKTDIGGNNVPDSDNNGVADYEGIENLEAYVTYSVILKSQTTKAVTETSTVEQFVYYYDDTVYSPAFSVNNVIDGYKVKSIEGNKITFESADSNNALSEGNDYRKEINLTFRINKNADGNLVVKENATNIVEITKYSTSEGGLIDKDSAPENGITDGRITSYEDDTDQAKGLNIVLRTDETRIITGTVFDDTYKDEAETEYDKDGILNNNNTVVNDIIVQLIEIKKIGGMYYEYIWQETRSGSNVVKKLSEDGNTIEEITYRETAPNDGSYVFADFIPGNYIIRYIYGDGTTYNLTDNVKTYNGQDYKSTIDPNYNKAWYNTSGYAQGQSVARDNEARRLEVMAYSTTVNATNGEALANKNMESLEKTWMCAETSRINIPVDDVEDAKIKTTDGNTNSTTTSYDYTKNNTKVLFGDMNFGLALRPETNIVLEKHITALKITPSGTGVQSLVDARVKGIESIVNGTEVEVQGVTTGLATIKSTRDNRGFWQVATDVEELMQGAELEVEYTYVIRNDSEEDYLSKTLVEAYENQDTIKPYNEVLAEIKDTVKTTMRNGHYSYMLGNDDKLDIGTYLGEFYYTGDKGANDALVSSRVETFEEALNNDLAFDESKTTDFKVTGQQVNKNVYGVNRTEETKQTEIDTVVQNTTVSTFLTPRLEENHKTTTADWSRTMTLTTTLATVSGGELGANLPSYIAEVVQYSNAAGRKDMTATPANLDYVHSDDTEMTMEKDNEQDEFWGESIIITKPTGEDKLTPIQIVIITISSVAVLGAGIVLIKKFVLKK